jgi:hypothetical protein
MDTDEEKRLERVFRANWESTPFDMERAMALSDQTVSGLKF